MYIDQHPQPVLFGVSEKAEKPTQLTSLAFGGALLVATAIGLWIFAKADPCHLWYKEWLVDRDQWDFDPKTSSAASHAYREGCTWARELFP